MVIFNELFWCSLCWWASLLQSLSIVHAGAAQLLYLVFEQQSPSGIVSFFGNVFSHKFLQATGKVSVPSAQSWASLFKPLRHQRDFWRYCFSIFIFRYRVGLFFAANCICVFFFSVLNWTKNAITQQMKLCFVAIRGTCLFVSLSEKRKTKETWLTEIFSPSSGLIMWCTPGNFFGGITFEKIKLFWQRKLWLQCFWVFSLVRGILAVKCGGRLSLTSFPF